MKHTAHDFALAALQGLLANPGGPVQVNDQHGFNLVNCTHADVARLAYRFADAMAAEQRRRADAEHGPTTPLPVLNDGL